MDGQTDGQTDGHDDSISLQPKCWLRAKNSVFANVYMCYELIVILKPWYLLAFPFISLLTAKISIYNYSSVWQAGKMMIWFKLPFQISKTNMSIRMVYINCDFIILALYLYIYILHLSYIFKLTRIIWKVRINDKIILYK